MSSGSNRGLTTQSPTCISDSATLDRIAQMATSKCYDCLVLFGNRAQYTERPQSERSVGI